MNLPALNFNSLAEKVPAMPALPAVNFNQPTWDLFIYLFFAVAVVMFALTLGRQRIVSVLLSVYLSLVVVNYLPYINKAWEEVDLNLGVFAFRLSGFAIVFVVAFFILSRSTILYEAAGAGRGIISAIIFSFLFVGMLLSIVLGFLPASAQGVFSEFTRQIFTSEVAKFVWLIMPMAAMAVLRGKREN